MAVEGDSLKGKVAGTLTWNAVDKVASQLLYAVTGIILARLLSQEDFGLVGAMLVFQAFASLFIDSGFSSALIQRKSPSREDYSTVLWFNIALACVIYIILFFCAPLIAWCFDNDQRLIPMSRVMFISFIINATAIVQTNRLMKQMNVRPIAVINSIGLVVAAVVGVILAFAGFGAWAIVWQTISLGATKSILLWIYSGWRPLWMFSWKILAGFFNVGSGVMVSSFLNTVFQTIYSFFIGHLVGLAPLGYYTQSDKWSKMGVMSLSQVLTSSFLPVLSSVQDNIAEFRRVTTKMNRFTAYVTFPAMGLLAMIATPLFHALFDTKWDASIVMFQILLARGVFTIFQGLYNNYILALGKARLIVVTEVVRDVVAAIAIVATLPFIGLSNVENPVLGLEILLYGQLAASVVTWIVTLVITSRISGHSVGEYLAHSIPYVMMTAAAMIVMYFVGSLIETMSPLLLAAIMLLAGGAVYLIIGAIAGSTIQRDILNRLFNRSR